MFVIIFWTKKPILLVSVTLVTAVATVTIATATAAIAATVIAVATKGGEKREDNSGKK